MTRTLAETPSAVVHEITCAPSEGVHAKGATPMVSPLGSPSTNHQSRPPATFPVTWHTTFCCAIPCTMQNTDSSSGFVIVSFSVVLSRPEKAAR